MQGSENLVNGENDNFFRKAFREHFESIFKIFGALTVRISSIQTCQVVVYVHLLN